MIDCNETYVIVKTNFENLLIANSNS